MSLIDHPVGLRKHEITRGWFILAMALVGIAVGASSLLFYSIGVFFEPLQREFNWNRGQISGALIYLTAGLVVSGPVVGSLIDRFGARIVALISIPLLVLSMVGLGSLNDSISAFYALFFAAGCFGGGTTPVVYTRVVNANFSASRGLALGIVLAGGGISALALPPLLASQIASFGWHAGFIVLAALAAVAWPLVYFGFRDLEGAMQPTRTVTAGAGRWEALRSRVFWTIAIGFLAVAAAISGTVVHLVPLLRDAGVPLSTAAGVASLIGVGVIAGRVLIGWGIDRIFAPYVACTVFLVAAAGCALLNYGGAQGAPVAALLIGFAFGAEIDLIAYLTARYFGMRNCGFLYGLAYSLFSVGAAAGPAVMGRLFDLNKNYEAALWLMVACLVFGALSLGTLPRFVGTSDNEMQGTS
ncbi:MFS transporter [Bradyrhizobium sp. CCGUVB23]|uniref:MFS transporter n=1 Tax=Bradyrhizobium sp. CCGUVB23 TaxID=2949630 RepID=UPI0020B37B46|nr:MFS transporter [Bradyrhizobium sp. CCGUVB23]MCP3461659.1 MFS transporter [Bradyrhizobium sp. CCGUVB23]